MKILIISEEVHLVEKVIDLLGKHEVVLAESPDVARMYLGLPRDEWPIDKENPLRKKRPRWDLVLADAVMHVSNASSMAHLPFGAFVACRCLFLGIPCLVFQRGRGQDRHKGLPARECAGLIKAVTGAGEHSPEAPPAMIAIFPEEDNPPKIDSNWLEQVKGLFPDLSW